jgi:PiT family inorganic phosphate transporter
MAIGSGVNFQQLWNTFFIPLLVSPFIAFALAMIIYWIFTCMRREMKITKESCICVGESRQLVPIPVQTSDACPGWNRAKITEPQLSVTIADADECMEMYTDKVCGVYLQKLLDIAHGLSAVTVSFARGLNDTPKIAGLLVAAEALDIRWGMFSIAMGMAIGGLLNARRVAETISNKITDLNHGQGFSANLVTGVLVIFASKFGVPVSTTHVSVGAIFGIGVITGKRDVSVIRNILLSWFITLPVAMIFSALVYWLISL